MKLLNRLLSPIVVLFLLMSNACTHKPQARDYIQMKVKEIIYGDENHLVTLEFRNISSEVCEFGDLPDSKFQSFLSNFLTGTSLTQEGRSIAHKGEFFSYYKILPHQSMITQISLPIMWNQKLTSAPQKIRYDFQNMRIGNSPSIQYGLYHLSSPI